MRKVELIPDFVTLINLSFGFLSIVHSMASKYEYAAFFIFAAIVADLADGLFARRFKKGLVSKFGSELDSLADLVSFGVAPGILIYSMYSLSPFALVSLLIPLAGAVRLARFNIIDDHAGFLGLPIPTVGGFLASIVFLKTRMDIEYMIIIIAFLSYLMVSKVKYPKYRSKELLHRPALPPLLLTASVILPILDSSLIFVPFGLYILLGFILRGKEK